MRGPDTSGAKMLKSKSSDQRMTGTLTRGGHDGFAGGGADERPGVSFMSALMADSGRSMNRVPPL